MDENGWLLDMHHSYDMVNDQEGYSWKAVEYLQTQPKLITCEEWLDISIYMFALYQADAFISHCFLVSPRTRYILTLTIF
jgi:hypothetical protein